MSVPHPGRWSSRAPDAPDGAPRHTCELCPRRCTLKPGQRGFCFVRVGTPEGVGLDTYGRSSGFCIDPIEKKPLHHFLPGTPVLSFGTAGCNLGCQFCQNWDISKARELDRLMDRASPTRIARTAARTGCRAVAYTYNDPVIFAEYAIDTAQACRALGVKNVAVTAGYIAAPARADFFGVMDAANIDLKAFSDEFYRARCLGALEPVKETLVYVAHHTDVWLELTTLLIPGLNDSDRELAALSAWVAEALGPDVPLHFSAYHPAWRATQPATPPSTLTHARRIAMEQGLRFVYTGNVHDPAGDTTWCPGCGAALIARDWYTLGAWGLDTSGRCASCGATIPGVFEPRPGTWGRRRQPLRIAP